MDVKGLMSGGQPVRSVRVRVLRWLLAGALYLVAPFDLVPDLVPVLGWLDDAAMVIVAVQGAVSACHGLRQALAIRPR